MIYLDMDGVLFDFVSAYLRYTGCADPYASKRNLKIGDLGRLTHTEDIFQSVMNSDDFWRSLKLYPGAKELIKFARSLDPVYIATTLSGYVSARHKLAAAKALGFCDGEIIFIKYKHLLARPSSILIDDHKKKCDAFKGAGGKAILVPRPWNVGYHDDDLKGTRYELGRLFYDASKVYSNQK